MQSKIVMIVGVQSSKPQNTNRTVSWSHQRSAVSSMTEKVRSDNIYAMHNVQSICISTANKIVHVYK